MSLEPPSYLVLIWSVFIEKNASDIVFRLLGPTHTVAHSQFTVGQCVCVCRGVSYICVLFSSPALFTNGKDIVRIVAADKCKLHRLLLSASRRNSRDLPCAEGQ